MLPHPDAGPGRAGPSRAEPQAPRDHLLLDNMIDQRLIGGPTAAVRPLIVWPLAIAAWLVIACSRLRDDWAILLPMAPATCAQPRWPVLLALLLKGDGRPFKRLIDAARNSQLGALAPSFEPPLLPGLGLLLDAH